MVATLDQAILVAGAAASIGINAVLALVATWFLPVRRRCLFFVCMIAAAVVATFVANPTGMAATNIAGFLINYIVLPCLFWEGPLLTRLICGFLLIAVQFSSEITLAAALSLAGMALDRDAGSALLLIMRLVNAVFDLIVGWILAFVVRRTIGCSVAHDALADEPWSVGVWRYGVFLLPQFAFLVVVSMAFMGYRDTEPQTYALVFLISIVCLAVDAIALLAFRRALAARRDAARAEALERALALHAENARAADEEARRAARFRHDQRNHLQSVLGLIERGQVQRAVGYINDLRRELADGEGTQ